MRNTIATLLLVLVGFLSGFCQVEKGKLIYSNSLTEADKLAGWVMEGPAEAVIDSGWLRITSSGQKGHHVWWCPEKFPSDFVAEWEVKNNHPQAGLLIVFFATSGVDGQSLFSADLNPRNGIFKQYTKGDIRNYHISYYANTPTQKKRPFAHLRKNPGFHKVHVGNAGIPHGSTQIHRIKLIKKGGHVQLYIDDRSVIDWQDDGLEYGQIPGDGYIGFRQMKWTDFSYRNFRIWELP